MLLIGHLSEATVQIESVCSTDLVRWRAAFGAFHVIAWLAVQQLGQPVDLPNLALFELVEISGQHGRVAVSRADKYREINACFLDVGLALEHDVEHGAAPIQGE